jgi:hypothetical protein
MGDRRRPIPYLQLRLNAAVAKLEIRARFKISWGFAPCGFDSHPPH